MKTLYGETKINDKDFRDFNKGFLINLKYYKTTEKTAKPDKKKYGIEIIKEEINGKNQIKEKSVAKYITNSEQIIEKLLKLLLKNKVTPIETNYILHDLRKNPEFIYNVNTKNK